MADDKATQKTLQEIADDEEKRLKAERDGKAPYYYPDHDITVWAKDKSSADKLLKSVLKKKPSQDNGGEEDTK